METKNNKSVLPSEANRESLNALSEAFKPSDVKFLLSLKSEFSLEECIDTAEGMVKRLHKFVQNGHSTDGLDFTYTQVKTI